MDSKNDYKIENANYYKVLYFIEKVLSETDKYCDCQQCRLDVAALALNTLPPHYFVKPEAGGTEELGSPWILIEMAVRESMEKVGLFPHHRPEGPIYPKSSEEDSMELEN